MTPALAFAALLCPVQFDNTVLLTPEAKTVRQGDPLLVRVDVRFGLLRPSHYAPGAATLAPASQGLVIAVLKPGGREYETIRTAQYDADRFRCYGVGPADQTQPEPYGKTDSAFLWIVADREPADTVAEARWRNGHGPAPVRKPDVTVFDQPGEYRIRARIALRDVQGAIYMVYSAPVAVRVGPQTPAGLAASDAVRPVLFTALPGGAFYRPDDADKVRAALPALGDSAAASAVRRVLALDALRHSAPGDPRRLAIAECDRTREAIPAVVQGAFDLDYASALAAVGEFEWALAHVRLAPAGPRRFWDGVNYHEQAQTQRRAKP